MTEQASGYIDRKRDGSYQGCLSIESIDISPIMAVYFKEGNDQYLWLKRKPLLEYDFTFGQYVKREREPQWEVYLKKQLNDNAIAYKGEFNFLHFRFSIIGLWDKVLGYDSQRLNLFVERMPMNEQTIINRIKNRNDQDTKKNTGGD